MPKGSVRAAAQVLSVAVCGKNVSPPARGEAGGKRRQHGCARCFDLDRKQVVGPRTAAIDGCDRLAHPRAPTRRSDIRSRPSATIRRRAWHRRARASSDASSTRCRGTFSPKNTTAGFSVPSHREQRRHAKRLDAGETPDPRRHPAPAWHTARRNRRIVLLEPALNARRANTPRRSPGRPPRLMLPWSSMHRGTACTLVQAIDVLGHQLPHASGGLELRQCPVRRIGPGAGNQRPPDHASRPVALPSRLGAQEIRPLHWRRALPLSVSSR